MTKRIALLLAALCLLGAITLGFVAWERWDDRQDQYDLANRVGREIGVEIQAELPTSSQYAILFAGLLFVLAIAFLLYAAFASRRGRAQAQRDGRSD
ncbi:MAG: hypothetical protein ACOC93_01665 [Planctomycetota bacterium]